MKRGSGMEDREERSKGIEILIVDDFDIIKPTAPFKLGSGMDSAGENMITKTKT